MYEEEDQDKFIEKIHAIKDNGTLAYINVDNSDSVTYDLIRNTPGITIIQGTKE